jgi:hypothetical protein
MNFWISIWSGEIDEKADGLFDDRKTGARYELYFFNFQLRENKPGEWLSIHLIDLDCNWYFFDIEISMK